MSRATHQLAQLWQLPLLLLSWLVFALAAYLFINSSPGLTVKKRIEMAQLYIQHERPEAALEQLNHLLTSERLTQESEGAVHLHIAEALEAAQRQRNINIPANHQRILEQTQLALGAGVHATGDAQRRLGDSCLALGQLSEAIAHYRQAMMLEPARSLRLRRKIIEIHMEQGDQLAAGAAIEEYLKSQTISDAERAWALGTKSEILADHGDYVVARALVSEALRLDPEPMAQAQANYRMAYCAYKLGNTDEAQRLATLARSQFRGHPADADAAYLLGRIRQEKEQFAEALNCYSDVLTRYADSRVALSARLGQAVCLANMGQEQALAAFAQLVDLLRTQDQRSSLGEQTVAALRDAGNVLAGKANYQSALEMLELERRLIPKPGADYFTRLATVSQKRAEQVFASGGAGAQQLGRELLIRAAQANLSRWQLDNSAVAFFAAVDLYDRSGQANAAIEVMEAMLAEHADYAATPDVLSRLGQAYQAAGSADKAITAYQQLIHKYPDSQAAKRVDVTIEIARSFYQSQRYDEAIARLEQLVKAADCPVDALFVSADSFRKSAMRIESQAADLTTAAAEKKRRLTQARKLFDQLIERFQKPGIINIDQKQYEKLAHFYRADCAFELGEFETALTLYDQAAQRYEQDPAALAAYVQIVNSYCSLGKMDQARTANEKAKLLLRRMPADAFNNGSFTMPKAYWEQWLKWTSTAGAW